MTDTISRLQKVFREVFDNDDITLRPEMTADDVEGWDSINHVNLVLSAEREFGVRLGSSSIAKLKNVGEFIHLLEAKIASPK